jgi:hypothetical protein
LSPVLFLFIGSLQSPRVSGPNLDHRKLEESLFSDEEPPSVVEKKDKKVAEAQKKKEEPKEEKPKEKPTEEEPEKENIDPEAEAEAAPVHVPAVAIGD